MQKLRRGEQKVLGIRWDLSMDQLVINLDDITSAVMSLSATKRNIVSLVGRFYDPLGYLAPVVVQFKLFLRDLCEPKIDWDQLLPGELMDSWKSLKLSLQESQFLGATLKASHQQYIVWVLRCFHQGLCQWRI